MNQCNKRKDNKYVSSLNQELHSVMKSDSRVVILGEDILDPYGGAFKVTKGLSSCFPGRVFTTPISESAIVGIAVGLSMRGFYPVVEIMFGDFLALAADQIINNAAKFRWMYNDNVSVPLVVRTPMGGRRGYGPTHSQCLEKHFIGVPGLWVIAPSIVSSPGDLLRKSILDCEDPVLFIENKTCYGKNLSDTVPDLTIEHYADKFAPFPSTLIRHNDIKPVSEGVLFCYGGMVPLCIEAVNYLRDQEGLYINIAIFSQLSPTPETHIRHILDKWNPKLCIYAEETSTVGGWSAEVIATVEEIQGARTTPASMRHIRIGGKHTAIPACKELESQTLPQVDDIVQLILNCF